MIRPGDRVVLSVPDLEKLSYNDQITNLDNYMASKKIDMQTRSTIFFLARHLTGASIPDDKNAAPENGEAVEEEGV